MAGYAVVELLIATVLVGLTVMFVLDYGYRYMKKLFTS